MEVIAITSSTIVVRQPCGAKALIPISDVTSSHPLVRDVLSYRLGYVAAVNAMAANDPGESTQ